MLAGAPYILLMPDEVHSVILKILYRLLRLHGQLLAVLRIGLPLANPHHLLDPVLVEAEVLVQAQERPRPAGCAAPFALLPDFEHGHMAPLVELLARLQEVESGHAADEAGAHDDEMVCRRSHVRDPFLFFNK